MTIVTTVPARIPTPGAVTVPGRLFADVLGRGTVDDVMLTADDLDFDISVGGLWASLRRIRDDPPPPITVGGPRSTSTMTADEARHAAAVAVAASTDAQRSVLTGVHLAPGTAEATDSFRVARTALGAWTCDVVVPADVLRLVASAGGDVHGEFNGRVISLSTAETSWTCSTIANAFPPLDWHYNVPTVEVVSCDRVEFCSAVESAAVLAGAPIDLRGLGSSLAVTSESTELGRIEATIAADAPTTLAASFAGLYLQDAAQLATGDHIEVAFCAKHATIRCEQFTQLVMQVVNTTRASAEESH